MMTSIWNLPNELIHQILLYLPSSDIVSCHLASNIFYVLTDNEMYRFAIGDPNLIENCKNYEQILRGYPGACVKLFSFFAKETQKTKDQLAAVIETNEKKLAREEKYHDFWEYWDRN